MKIRLTYRKKLLFFICGSILLTTLAWSFGFSKSFSASRELYSVKEQAEIVKSSEFIKAELEEKLLTMNIQLGSLLVIEDDQEYILATVNQSSESSQVRIIEILGTATQTDNGMVRNTYGATVEGDFADLVRLLRTFEESGHDGNLVSAGFYRYTDNKTRKASTRLKFYLQEIKPL